jgi:primosomal protein N' (replication factor Y)
VGAPRPARRGQARPRADLTGTAAPIARVVPDVAAIDRPLDYVVPDRLDGHVRVGSVVRIPLHGRRVRGWVVGRVAEPETDRPLQALAKVTGWGPPPDLVLLAEWAAWRWAGPRVTFLRAASPPGAVPALPAPPVAERATERPDPAMGPVVSEAFGGGAVAVRVPPASDTFPFVAEAARRGDALVLAPSVAEAAYVAARLRHAGHPVAVLPREWARAAAGGCVAVGARAAAWAPRPRLGAVVVLDEHDELYQEERAPTWNARDVVVERARRSGVPVVLTSPCPSLETLASIRLLTLSRADEREGWPVVEVVDRRSEEPGLGLYSSRLVDLVRSADGDRRVICVLNRRGRARLLACGTCQELARCDECGAVVEEAPSEEGPDLRGPDAVAALRCRRCGAVRPYVCAACGSARLRVLRAGVSRVRDDLERLAGRPVAEVTADLAPGLLPAAPVLVGTEAVLHRAARAAAVAFLDLDQELVAPRWRAGEEALALLVRAARVLGGRADGGRLLLQTRLPTHEVVDAVVHAEPSRLAVVEAARRVALGFPPERAVAVVSGEAAPSFAAALEEAADVEVVGPADGRWLVRAPDHRTLCDTLAATPRPKGRLRVAVDPLRG